MDIHKAAAVAQILSFPTGAYCAYGAWVALHPSQSGIALPVILNSTALAVSFGVFVTCLIVFGAGYLPSARRSATVKRRDDRAGPQVGDSPLVKSTRAAYAGLSVCQRIALRIVYERPGIDVSVFADEITNLGFTGAVANQILHGVLRTNLVERDVAGNVKPNPAVANTVEILLQSDDAPLTTTATAKELIRETSLGLTSEHLHELATLKAAHKVETEALAKEVKEAERHKVSEEVIRQVGEASLLYEHAEYADFLVTCLEKIWHRWNNEGQALIHPLGVSTLPDEIKTHLHMALLEFRIAFRLHIEAVHKSSPQFNSNILADGFPSEEEYITVKMDLKNHAAFMRDRAKRLIDAVADGATEAL